MQGGVDLASAALRPQIGERLASNVLITGLCTLFAYICQHSADNENPHPRSGQVSEAPFLDGGVFETNFDRSHRS